MLRVEHQLNREGGVTSRGIVSPGWKWVKFTSSKFNNCFFVKLGVQSYNPMRLILISVLMTQLFSNSRSFWEDKL